MHHGFQNTHLRIAKMHMMINKNMIIFGASSLRHTLAIVGPLQTQQLKEALISGQTEKTSFIFGGATQKREKESKRQDHGWIYIYTSAIHAT